MRKCSFIFAALLCAGAFASSAEAATLGLRSIPVIPVRSVKVTLPVAPVVKVPVKTIVVPPVKISISAFFASKK